MRRITITAAALALSLATPTYAQTNNNDIQAIAKNMFAKLGMKKPAMKAMQAAEKMIWLPGTETEYEYDNYAWSVEAETKYTYDKKGNVVAIVKHETDDDRYPWTKTELTYDDKGNCTNTLTSCSTDGTIYNPVEKTIVKYDESTIMPVEVETMTYNAYTNQWTTNMHYRFDITRNAKGDMTSMTHWTLDKNGDWKIYEKMEFEYTEGSKGPTAFTEDSYYDDDDNISDNPTSTIKITDIVWEKYDGKFIANDFEEFASGNNVIKSAKASMYVEDYDTNMNFDVTNETTDDGGFTLTASTSMLATKLAMVYKKEMLDNNGSYKLGSYIYLNALEIGATVADKNLLSGEYDDITKDEKGNVTHSASYEMEEGEKTWSLDEATDTEYKYEGEHGELTEKIITEYDEDNMVTEKKKYTYSDFMGINTGINAVTTANNAKTEYYNMQGMKVDAPTEKGIYIIKQGDYTKKMIKR